jgi:hypothetical protein
LQVILNHAFESEAVASCFHAQVNFIIGIEVQNHIEPGCKTDSDPLQLFQKAYVPFRPSCEILQHTTRLKESASTVQRQIDIQDDLQHREDLATDQATSAGQIGGHRRLPDTLVVSHGEVRGAISKIVLVDHASNFCREIEERE